MRLAKIGDAATERTEGIIIEVFVDQDGEGPFDVRARFEGSDAFALDRRLDAERHLFGVVWGERDWKPAVPSRPHGWTRDELEEVVVDTVAEWLGPLVPIGERGLRWDVASPEGTLGAALRTATNEVTNSEGAVTSFSSIDRTGDPTSARAPGRFSAVL